MTCIVYVYVCTCVYPKLGPGLLISHRLGGHTISLGVFDLQQASGSP